MNDYESYDALGLAELIRKKEVKPSEVLEGLVTKLIGSFHEVRDLEVNADDVGTERLDLAEVLDHGRPLVEPVLFQETPLAVVVVVDSPGEEALVVLAANEVLPVQPHAALRMASG